MSQKQTPGKEWGEANRRESSARAKEAATDKQWEFVGMAVDAFIQKYPKQWMSFQEQLKEGRREYNLAYEGDLKKSGFRNTGAFPVLYKLDKDGEMREHDALLPVLNKIIPGLTHQDSKNYREFLKRFPAFQVPEKI